MKSLFVAISIAIVVVFGSLLYNTHLESISSQMIEKNEGIKKQIEEENYAEASKKTRDLTEFIRDKRTVLDAVGNHEELDEIERTLMELCAFSDDSMHGEALSKCNSLDFLIRALPRNFKIKIENVL